MRGVVMLKVYCIRFSRDSSSFLFSSSSFLNPILPCSLHFSSLQLSARLLTLQQQTQSEGLAPPTSTVTMDTTSTTGTMDTSTSEGEKSNEQLWEIIRCVSSSPFHLYT